MENKDKIKKLRAQIANLKEMLKGKNSSEKEEAILGKIKELEMQIQKILEVGNGDGTGRKPTSYNINIGTRMMKDPKK